MQQVLLLICNDQSKFTDGADDNVSVEGKHSQASTLENLLAWGAKQESVAIDGLRLQCVAS